MKGDFSRSTYRREKHYRSVRMQQGRVQVDADWNEQLDISEHRIETGTADLVGLSGTPIVNPGFGLVLDENNALDPGDFYIEPGRYYVDGILCENEKKVAFSLQPDLHEHDRPEVAGDYLIYLDVWERHLTAFDDSDIREVALGGPDTSTRTKIVWQVKWELLANNHSGCSSSITEKSLRENTGTLSAQAQPTITNNEPCLLDPGAGFQRVENQLYRVEVHASGDLDVATFKWSRDNGSFIVGFDEQRGEAELLVSNSGRDPDIKRFEGNWAELTDDTQILQGKPGILVKVTAVNGQALSIDPPIPAGALTSFTRNPKVRLWNGVATIAQPGTNEGFLELEAGVQVKFEPGSYHTGDYWLIPARIATGDVLWPFTTPQSPQGIQHHYCPLGILSFDETALTIVKDCRDFFPANTDLTSLFYVGGDGQEAGPPGFTLPQSLQVGVSNGSWPVLGETVEFRILPDKDGTVDGILHDEQSSLEDTSLKITTNSKGIASCRWTLNSNAPSQQVEATLLTSSETSIHLPIRFTASLGSSSLNAGVHVEKISLANGKDLRNDFAVSISEFLEGVDIVCDTVIEPTSIEGRPVCDVSLELPWPSSTDDTKLWGTALLGYHSIKLAANLSHKTINRTSAISWRPKFNKTALETGLETLLKGMDTSDGPARILAHLTLRGNFIWQAGKPEIWIDGDVFGRQEKLGRPPTDIRLPSGDGHPGGNLEMWFWLIEGTAQPTGTVLIIPDISGRNWVLKNGLFKFEVRINGTRSQDVEFKVNRAGIVKEDEKTPGWFIYEAPGTVPKLNPVTITAISNANKEEDEIKITIVEIEIPDIPMPQV